MSAMAQPLKVVSWVNVANEPDYAAEPYTKATYTTMQAPSDWVFDAGALDWDAAWALMGDAQEIKNGTNVEAGDVYDGTTYGASWKAMHDGTNIYVFIQWLGFDKADAGTANMEVMFQPTSPERYEPDFTAAAGDMVLQNHSYGRFVELGGAKAVFKDATITEAAASTGTIYNAAGDKGSWGSNDHALEQLAMVDHYSNVDGGTLKAVMVMPFETLSYPKDVHGALDDRTAFEVTADAKIAWEMKANAKINALKAEYCWSSNKNNVYAVNYYAGLMSFATGGSSSREISADLNAYFANDRVVVEGSQTADVQIYNIGGQLVKSAANVNAVEVSDLVNGTYIARLKVGTQVKAMKFVKF
jgi:hypothetical protein